MQWDTLVGFSNQSSSWRAVRRATVHSRRAFDVSSRLTTPTRQGPRITVTRAAKLVTAIAVAALTVAACSSSGTGGSTAGGTENLGTIRVATVTPFDLSDAPLFDTTVWDNSGVTVKMITATSPTADPLLATGGTDIVVESSNKPVASIAKGVPATIVATTGLSWGQNIISKKSITDAAQLKGKTFGVSGFGSGGYFATQKVAEHFGWGKSDYKVVQLGGVDQLTAGLKSGAIDAFIWNPQQAAQLASEGFANDLGSVDPYVKASGAVFVVSNKFIQEHPKTLKAYFEAYFKGVEKYRANPELAVTLAVDKFKQTKSAVESVYKEEMEKLSTDGNIPDENLQGMAEAAKISDDSLKGDIDMGKIYKYWKDAAP